MCDAFLLGRLVMVRTSNFKFVGRVSAVLLAVVAFVAFPQPSKSQNFDSSDSGCVASCPSAIVGGGWNTGPSYFAPAPAQTPIIEPVIPQTSAAKRQYSDERDADKETVLSELIPIKVGANRHAVYVDDRGGVVRTIFGTGGGIDFGNSSYSPLALVEGNQLPSEHNEIRLRQAGAILATLEKWRNSAAGVSDEDAYFMAREASFAMAGHNVRVSLETGEQERYGLSADGLRELKSRSRGLRNNFGNHKRVKKRLEKYRQAHAALKTKHKQVIYACERGGDCGSAEAQEIWGLYQQQQSIIHADSQKLQQIEVEIESQSTSMNAGLQREIIVKAADAP